MEIRRYTHPTIVPEQSAIKKWEEMDVDTRIEIFIEKTAGHAHGRKFSDHRALLLCPDGLHPDGAYLR